MPRPARLLSLLLPVMGTACARYTPVPLDPAAVASELEARRLDARGLVRYLSEHGSTAPGNGWSAADLALAAIYYHAELDRTRAEWAAARAAAGSAGVRARPDIEGEAGYGVTGTDAAESRWVTELAAVFTLELGGKRGARVAAARARAAAAEVELEASAWRIAHRTRLAAGELAAAEGRVDNALAERGAADALTAAIEAGYARGELRGAELALIEARAVESRTLVAGLTTQSAVARSALAAAIGVPVAALDRVTLRFDEPPPCTGVERPDSVRAVALRTRVEVGRALASYAVAEADLRVAVAGSYPDLALGPGFTWDQGVGRWSLLFGLPRLPLDGNRGPIAEASRRREAAAANVTVAEQQVLGDVQTALARCTAALAEAAGADSIAAAAERRGAVVGLAFGRGETGAGDTVAAALPVLRARASAAEARRRLAAAHLALAAAVGTWPAGTVQQPDPRRAPRVLEEMP